MNVPEICESRCAFSFPDTLYTIAICHSINCTKNKVIYFMVFFRAGEMFFVCSFSVWYQDIAYWLYKKDNFLLLIKILCVPLQGQGTSSNEALKHHLGAAKYLQLFMKTQWYEELFELVYRSCRSSQVLRCALLAKCLKSCSFPLPPQVVLIALAWLVHKTWFSPVEGFSACLPNWIKMDGCMGVFYYFPSKITDLQVTTWESFDFS